MRSVCFIYVCVSVCPRAYLKNQMSELQQISTHVDRGRIAESFSGVFATDVIRSGFADDVVMFAYNGRAQVTRKGHLLKMTQQLLSKTATNVLQGRGMHTRCKMDGCHGYMVVHRMTYSVRRSHLPLDSLCQISAP